MGSGVHVNTVHSTTLRPSSRTPGLLAVSLCLLVAGFGIPAAVAAQESPAGLVMRVFGADSDQGLELASVQIAGTGLAVLTDGVGLAALWEIPPGPRVVQVSRLGYKTERIRIEFPPDSTVAAEVSLLVSPISVEGVEVIADIGSPALRASGFFQRRIAGQGTFITPDEMKKWRAYPDLSRPLSQILGFWVSWDRLSRNLSVLSTRGPVSFNRGCRPTLFVDGMRWVGDQSFLNTLRPRQGQAIEAYAGPGQVPAQFRSASACGVLVIWMR